mmetsp:Transcript_132084/g.341820  ORF Transcript_132084/g.341820 Transcript_132084/m.341820 type:complete len:402 (-) Transcript_132084:421-1626(-)
MSRRRRNRAASHLSISKMSSRSLFARRACTRHARKRRRSSSSFGRAARAQARRTRRRRFCSPRRLTACRRLTAPAAQRTRVLSNLKWSLSDVLVTFISAAFCLHLAMMISSIAVVPAADSFLAMCLDPTLIRTMWALEPSKILSCFSPAATKAQPANADCARAARSASTHFFRKRFRLPWALTSVQIRAQWRNNRPALICVHSKSRCASITVATSSRCLSTLATTSCSAAARQKATALLITLSRCSAVQAATEQATTFSHRRQVASSLWCCVARCTRSLACAVASVQQRNATCARNAASFVSSAAWQASAKSALLLSLRASNSPRPRISSASAARRLPAHTSFQARRMARSFRFSSELWPKRTKTSPTAALFLAVVPRTVCRDHSRNEDSIFIISRTRRRA